jgi:hypothetical protein
MTSAMHETNATNYIYPVSQTAIIYLLMPMVSLISLGLGWVLLGANNIIVGFFLILFGALLVFLSAFGSLMYSSIVINDEGIATRNYGRTLKFIPWTKVVKIKKVRRWNAGSRSFEDVFHIFNGSSSGRMVNLRGPIVFTDKIRGLRTLLDKLNASARKYHFALVALDQEAARKIAGQSRVRAWKRIVPDVEETPLAEL